jgi:hypothetical protein
MHPNQKQLRHLRQRPSSTPKNQRSWRKKLPQNAKIRHAIKRKASGYNRMMCTDPIVPEVILRNQLVNVVPGWWVDVDPAAWIRIRKPPK